MTEKDLIKIKPNLLVTIDSPDFNFRILKRISNKIPFTKKDSLCSPNCLGMEKWKSKIFI